MLAFSSRPLRGQRLTAPTAARERLAEIVCAQADQADRSKETHGCDE